MEKDKEKMRSLMIDHIDGILTGELSKYLENHINKSKEAKKEYEQLKEVMGIIDSEEEIAPKAQSREDFLKILEKEKEYSAEKQGKVVSIHFEWNTFYKVAAAVILLVVGFLAGRTINQNKNDMEAIQLQLQETRELVLFAMLNEESASERIKGVMASYEIERVDEEIIDALIRSMNTDKNINVRIAALEGLSRFSSEEKVRLALIGALKTQEYPAVQIRLIETLVKMGEERALQPLQEIAVKEDILESVRDQAQMGVFKLM